MPPHGKRVIHQDPTPQGFIGQMFEIHGNVVAEHLEVVALRS